MLTSGSAPLKLNCWRYIFNRIIANRQPKLFFNVLVASRYSINIPVVLHLNSPGPDQRTQKTFSYPLNTETWTAMEELSQAPRPHSLRQFWYVRWYTYIHIYIYTYIHVYIYTYIHIYIYTYIHIYIYTYIHIYIYTYIYIHNTYIYVTYRLYPFIT